MLSVAERKFELFAGPSQDSEEDLILRECLTGDLWERYLPAKYNGPRVHLTDQPQSTKALAVLGLVFPDAQISSQSLTTFFRERPTTARVTELGTYELVFSFPVREPPILLNETLLERDPEMNTILIAANVVILALIVFAIYRRKRPAQEKE